MVGDHRHDVRVELAAAPAPEQVEQAVVVAGDEDRDAPALAPPADLPVHLEALRDLGREARLEALASSLRASSSSRKNSVRRKKRPPVGSEEYWWEETMLAPCSNRKPETAATIPGGPRRRSAGAPCSGGFLRIGHRASAPALFRRRGRHAAGLRGVGVRLVHLVKVPFGRLDFDRLAVGCRRVVLAAVRVLLDFGQFVLQPRALCGRREARRAFAAARSPAFVLLAL